ncbi:MAG: ribosomal RNA small subunit methyltransferase A [Planctomycetota bacterium]|nr:MAG: ribosomal RNA small subunit methyltransferase A [Planctomycetota bacterium]
MKLSDLRDLLAAHGLRPNPRFGQNFLVDPALLRRIPEDAGVEVGDSVLEVGPGAGSLTFELLKAGAKVVAVELDHGFLRLLRERFEGELEDGSLTLIEGDILGPHETMHPEVEAWWEGLEQPPRLVANLPYAISGPFLGRLPGRKILGATLLLQREVADKAAGPVSKEEWSPLSIRLHFAFEAQTGRRLPPEVFWPRPKIESAFLQLRPKSTALAAASEEALREVLRFAFGQRRKTLLGRLGKQYPLWADALEAEGVDPKARPGSIVPATWRAALERVESS